MHACMHAPFFGPSALFVSNKVVKCVQKSLTSVVLFVALLYVIFLARPIHRDCHSLVFNMPFTY